MSQVDLRFYEILPEPPPFGEEFRVVHLLPRSGAHIISSTCWCKPVELEDNQKGGEDFVAWIHGDYVPKWG
jgi:hypothetical protein